MSSGSEFESSPRPTPVLFSDPTSKPMQKPTPLDLEGLDDPNIMARFTRFDELNEDSIQSIWRDPADGILDQDELKKLPFVNDWQYPFRTAIWRYRTNSRNPFLFWDTLYPDSQAKVARVYGLGANIDFMYFFIWLIKGKHINNRQTQRVVEVFTALDSDAQTKLLQDYNNFLNKTP